MSEEIQGPAATVRPQLSRACDVRPLSGGGVLIHANGLGASLYVPPNQVPLVQAMTGEHDLQTLEAQADGVSWQSVAVLLFRLWERGFLANDGEVRRSLFPERDPDDREFVRERWWRRLRSLTTWGVRMPGIEDPLRGLSKVGRALGRREVLLALGGLTMVGIAVLLGRAVAWPSDLLGLGSGGVGGLVLAWVAVVVLLSVRGLGRAAFLASLGSGIDGAQLKLAGGFAFVDVDDAEVEHWEPSLKARFRLAGLLLPAAVSSLAVLSGLIGAPEWVVRAGAVGYLVTFVQLCPFFETDGAGLVELLADLPGQRTRVRRYVTRNLVGGLLSGRTRPGDGLFAMVTTLWFVWFFAAFHLVSALAVPHLIDLTLLIFDAEGLFARAVGGAFLLLTAAILVAMGVAVLVVTFSLARQLVRRPGKAAPQGEVVQVLTTEDRVRLWDAVCRLMPDGTADSTLSELTSGAQQERYPKGSWLYHAGEEDRRFYWVLEGGVELLSPRPEGGHSHVTTVRVGQNLGDEALHGGVHLHSARALEDTIVLALSNEAFEDALAGDPESAAAVRAQLSRATQLGRTSALAALDPGARLQLAAGLAETEYAAGDALVRQGEEAQSMFLIQSGKVRVVRTGEDGVEQAVAELGPGETVGEAGILFGKPRNATVYADEATCVIEVPGAALREALDRSFHIGLALETVARRRSL